MGKKERQRKLVSSAEHFADALRGTNPKFDRERFINAAMGEPSNGRDRAIRCA